jgi:hypothetical protein
MTPQNRIQARTLSRRAMLLKTAGSLGTASLLTLSNSSYGDPLWQSASGAKLNGRLKQSACRWCYQKLPLEDLAKFASEIGLKGIDLLNDPSDWPVVKKYGLIPTMVSGAGTIPDACNRKAIRCWRNARPGLVYYQSRCLVVCRCHAACYRDENLNEAVIDVRDLDMSKRSGGNPRTTVAPASPR